MIRTFVYRDSHIRWSRQAPRVTQTVVGLAVLFQGGEGPSARGQDVDIDINVDIDVGRNTDTRYQTRYRYLIYTVISVCLYVRMM